MLGKCLVYGVEIMHDDDVISASIQRIVGKS